MECMSEETELGTQPSQDFKDIIFILREKREDFTATKLDKLLWNKNSGYGKESIRDLRNKNTQLLKERIL